jgi:hypothetical protein
MTTVSLPTMFVQGRVLDHWIYLLLLIFGVILLLYRSGLSFKTKRKKYSQVIFNK